MAYVPTSPGRAPVWDSDTDEVQVEVEGTRTIVVPPQCCYMVFTISDLTSGTSTLFVSPNFTDLNSGVGLEDGVGGFRNFGVAVEPGTSIFLHTPSLLGDAIFVNMTRFYRKP